MNIITILVEAYGKRSHGDHRALAPYCRHLFAGKDAADQSAGTALPPPAKQATQIDADVNTRWPTSPNQFSLLDNNNNQKKKKNKKNDERGQ
jgi:hypothetical protein